MGFGFDFMFNVFPVFFGLFFVVFLVVFITAAVKGLSQWNKNNHSPRLTVQAAVVAKRTQVSRHRNANAGDATGAHGYTTSSVTTYYVTFQVESGDRMELQVGGAEYGMLVEGDTGKLSFQGTRYLSFQRD